jgi:DNA-nicking Smr family endonuclease
MIVVAEMAIRRSGNAFFERENFPSTSRPMRKKIKALVIPQTRRYDLAVATSISLLGMKKNGARKIVASKMRDAMES